MPALSLLLFLSACHSVPKHVRFIPKDALAVIGIHTGEMRKEITWSAIMGSNLLDEMQKQGGQKSTEMMKDMDNSGIDFSSTIYGYSRPDNRFENGMKLSAILPVADEQKLSDFIRKHAPGIAIHQLKDRNEIFVDGKVYIGWNKEVMIAMNPIVRNVHHDEPAKMDTLGGTAYPGSPYSWEEHIPDSSATVAEMDRAFNPGAKTSISDNPRFKQLEQEGHDISLWISYDAMADKWASNGGGDMGAMGMGVANTLWKSSAMVMGMDFKKGTIHADMRYYSSDSMKEVAREFGKTDVDKEMLKHLPSAGLNAALGYRVSPTAIKMLLDKMGLSGIANLALMDKGMSVDDILGAFSGDMVASLNNFKVETSIQQMDSATMKTYGMTPYPVTTPKMDFVYAIKVGDKSKMNKLINFLTGSDMLKSTSPGHYSIAGTSNGLSLIVDDHYAIVGNTPATAEAYLKENGGIAVPVSNQISGHVTGLWIDIHSLLQAAGAMAHGSPSDSMAYNTVKGMFQDFNMSGGEYRGDANVYTASLNFMNKEENSLIQLLHMMQQLNALNGSKKEVAIQ